MKTRSLTLLEILIATAVVAGLATALIAFQVTSFQVYGEQQVRANCHRLARQALDQLRDDTVSALSETTWAASGMQTLYNGGADPNTNARGITWREAVGVNTGTRSPLFGPTVTFVGPHTGSFGTPDQLPAAGLVRLRASGLDPTVPSTYSALSTAGADGVFGTFDDDTSRISASQPECTLLIPATYAPRTGPMFRVDRDRLQLTYTLRLNLRRGSRFLLDTDVVVSEVVAFKQ